MGECAEKRLLTAPNRSACPCPKTYPFPAATLPTVRDEQFMGILELLVTGPPFRRTGIPEHRLEYLSFLDRSDQQLLGPVLYFQRAQTDARHLIEKVDIRESIRRVYEKMARQPVMIGDIVILREQPPPHLQNSGDL